jgi:hypothetical protein
MKITITIELPEPNLEPPTSGWYIEQSRQLMELHMPRWASVAARGALELLVLDAVKAADVWPKKSNGGRVDLGRRPHGFAHILAAIGVISPEMYKAIERAWTTGGNASHPKRLKMADVLQLMATTDELAKLLAARCTANWI